MLSIKNKLLVCCLIANLGGFGINELNKVEELYKAKKYTKAYKKAYKLKGEATYFKKAKTYYFLGFSLLNLSQSGSKKLGVSIRDKAIVHNVSKGLKYQRNPGEFSRFKSSESSFIQVAKKRMLFAKKSRKEKEWKDISKMLATHFKDTTAEYWEAFPVKVESKKTVVKSKEIVKQPEAKIVKVKEAFSPNKKNQIVAKAKTYIGVPYLHAGTSRKGIDCSGFTSKILNQFGTSLPHSAKLQSTKGTKVKKYEIGVVCATLNEHLCVHRGCSRFNFKVSPSMV